MTQFFLVETVKKEIVNFFSCFLISTSIFKYFSFKGNRKPFPFDSSPPPHIEDFYPPLNKPTLLFPAIPWLSLLNFFFHHTFIFLSNVVRAYFNVSLADPSFQHTLIFLICSFLLSPLINWTSPLSTYQRKK